MLNEDKLRKKLTKLLAEAVEEHNLRAALGSWKQVTRRVSRKIRVQRIACDKFSIVNNGPSTLR